MLALQWSFIWYHAQRKEPFTMTHQHSRVTVTAALLASILAFVAPSVPAQVRHEGREHARGPEGYPGAHFRFDERYHHDHYYPMPGYAYGALPRNSVSVVFRGDHFFFQGGVWFRPYGPRFVVVTPPLGVVVPLLPPAYATLWIGGLPYYYANGVYYTPVNTGGYVVVAPPPGADAVQAQPQPMPVPPPPDPIIYPRNGQSSAQTEADRQECNRWATTQPSAMADASVFQRAMAACLDGRGYTVR
jgi:hypothetical protein